jgi:hypothetical protein
MSGMLDSEFFPTPPKLISRMLAGIDWGEVTTVLEPSAGKGDIAAKIALRLLHANENSYRYRNWDEADAKGAIDCVELAGVAA